MIIISYNDNNNNNSNNNNNNNLGVKSTSWPKAYL